MAERKWTRRNVIRTGAAGAAGLITSRFAGPAYGARGANERINIAVAGIHGRGGSHIKGFGKLEGVRISHIVDPDTRLFDGTSKFVQEVCGQAPATATDIREILDNKDIDAISIATPNHWHSLMTIWACQAGKDVFVEKPLSHNVHEGKVAVQAARKYDRIVQHGTQRRSDPGWWRVIAAIQSGKLGKLKVARGLCYKRRRSIGVKPDSAAPDGLDYNLWLGPAAKRPYNGNYVHYNWHWFWPFGNGDIGNQGVHQMDVAHWAIKDAKMPESVIALGGRFGYEDQADTPNTQIAVMQFGETQLIFEVRGLETEPFRGAGVGNIFHLEAGTIVEHTFYPNGSRKPAPLPEVPIEIGPGKGHYANFIEAVRSHKRDDLNADIEKGYYSAALCHLANISYRLGKDTTFGPVPGIFGNNRAGNWTLADLQQNLAFMNGLDLTQLRYRLGRKLAIDANTERIANDPKADAMLFAKYRAPFVVPESL